MKRYPKSTVLPLILLAYLAVMAVIGLPELRAGNWLYYFGIIGATLVCIALLHFTLKKREKLRRERTHDIDDTCSDVSPNRRSRR